MINDYIGEKMFKQIRDESGSFGICCHYLWRIPILKEYFAERGYNFEAKILNCYDAHEDIWNMEYTYSKINPTPPFRYIELKFTER